jgi:hypothetical protein
VGDSRTRAPFIGGLPERGIWTAVGLGRGQFLAILGISVLLFVLVGGPVWSHLRESHFGRIVWSYAFIVPAVTAALHRNGRARPLAVLAASAVIALVKLLVTAGLLIAIALAR